MAEYQHLAQAKETILNAANNGLIFALSQPQAHDVRSWLSRFRLDNQARRKWIARKAKEISFDIVVHFGLPQEIDVDEVRAFLIILAAIDVGDKSQVRAFTQSQAKHFLAYVVALNDEAQFLLQLQRDTLEHERMASDG